MHHEVMGIRYSTALTFLLLILLLFTSLYFISLYLGRIPFFHFEDVCGSKLMRGTLLSSPTLVNVANGDDDEDKNTYRTIKSPRYSVFKVQIFHLF